MRTFHAAWLCVSAIESLNVFDVPQAVRLNSSAIAIVENPVILTPAFRKACPCSCSHIPLSAGDNLLVWSSSADGSEWRSLVEIELVRAIRKGCAADVPGAFPASAAEVGELGHRSIGGWNVSPAISLTQTADERWSAELDWVRQVVTVESSGIGRQCCHPSCECCDCSGQHVDDVA